MSTRQRLASHYARQQALVQGIFEALVQAGIDIDSLDPKSLSGADEFHLGGRMATLAVLDAVRPSAPSLVLDVGCGIGGPARTMAVELGAKTLGVDLTPSFVAAAEQLTARVGLADRVSFEAGDALCLDQPDERFDLVTLFHVGMNIADKRALFRELGRVLRPGGQILVYDIMRIAPGELILPVPWASSVELEHVAEPEVYISALRGAGLEPGEWTDHREIVARALEQAAKTPPPVNLSHLMGRDFAEMFANLRNAVAAGVVAPIQIVATKVV